MTNIPSDTSRSFRRRPVRTSIRVVAKAARFALGLSHKEQAFEKVHSDTSRSFRRRPVRTSIRGVAKAARIALGLRHKEQAFELPAALFEQLPFAVYLCDRDGLILRY